MIPELQLVLGCLMLSLVVCYIWWTGLRVLSLQVDLLSILDELDQSARTSRFSDNPEYLVLREGIIYLARNPGWLSIDVILECARLCGEAIRSLAKSARDDDSEVPSKILIDSLEWIIVCGALFSAHEVPSEVLVARRKIQWRLFVFLFFQSETGWLFLLKVLIFAKVRARVENLIASWPDSRDVLRVERLASPKIWHA